MVESSVFKRLCNDCLCGMCCFFSDKDFYGFMLDSDEVLTDKNDEYHTKIIKSVCRGNDLTRVIDKYFPEKIDKKEGVFYTKLDKNIRLLIPGFFPIYACSLLNVEVNDDTAVKMSCLIHGENSQNDLRGHTCRNFTAGFLNPCFPTLKLNITGITIKDKFYRLNEELRRVLE